MKLSFLNFTGNVQPQTNVAPQKISTNIAASNLKPLAADVFQKINTTNIKSVQQVDSENSLKKLYDEIFQQTMKHTALANPYVKELGINKPTLVFSNDFDSKSTIASYTFNNNTIKINSKNFNQDWYALFTKNKNGERENILGTRTQSELSNALAEYKEIYPDCEIESVKLTDKEKELMYSSAIAHELRHCMQSHVLMCTEGGAQQYKEILQSHKNLIDEDMKKVQKLEQEMKKLDPNYVPQEAKDVDYSYALSFEPKKILDKNTIFKLSPLDSNQTSFNVQEFLKAELDKISGKDYTQGEDGYYSFPGEIDAYNFGFEYYLLNSSKNDEQIRQDILAALSSRASSASEYGIEVAQKNNRKFFV